MDKPFWEHKTLADMTVAEWQSLITGDPDSVHAAGISVQAKATSELENSEPTLFRNLST
ncbi:MAG: hypothetical protein IIB76_00140 [Proteobacteria bacterium]|nr:hypothetical protein [Pseudomonadota bacterium]